MMPPSDDEIEDTTGSPDTVPVDDADTTAASDTADGNIPELDDYDDDKADDPERIARDTQLPPDSTTPDDLLPGSLTTHPGGSLGRSDRQRRDGRVFFRRVR